MKEIRSIDGAEFRIQPKSRRIEGYALLFNIESQDLGGFREKIVPEALNNVIERSDILALYNHLEDKVLARNTAGKGTLLLEIDEKGLKYSFDAPKTPIGDEVLDAIERGDLRNSSFAFTITENGQKWEKRDDSYLRTITQLDKLFDVSPVFRPAYLDTTVASRSLSEIKEEVVVEEEKLDENVIESTNNDEVIEEITNETETKSVDATPEASADEVVLVDITYDGDVLSVPKDILEPYLSDRKFEKYLEELDSSIDELKK